MRINLVFAVNAQLFTLLWLKINYILRENLWGSAPTLWGSQWDGSFDAILTVNFLQFWRLKVIKWKFNPISHNLTLYKIYINYRVLEIVLAFLSFRNNFRYTQFLKSCNVQKECFLRTWELVFQVGAGFLRKSIILVFI